MKISTNTSKHFTIPVFIPELACPFQCIFCNQKNISGRSNIPSIHEVKDLIYRNLSTIDTDNSKIEIGFFGGNFTGIDLEIQKAFLIEANKFLEQSAISGIRISTRPDYIDENILSMLKEFNVTAIELGAQSLDDEILRLSGRGHKARDIERASELINRNGFKLGLQMMIGLPGDSLEKSIYTAKKIVELGAENTRVYPTLVIKDTALEKLYLQKKYIPLTLEEAVLRGKEVFNIFDKGKVKILRMGLHPSEGLISGNSYIAGPFHIGYRELVMTEIWNDKFSNFNFQKDRNEIIISVSPDQLNFAIGYQAKNKKMLNTFVKKVKFKADNNLSEREFNVDYC